MCSRPAQQSFVAIALVAVGAAAAGADVRTWTDNTGRFSIEAALVEVRADSVVLKKANGATVAVPLARLCQADREYLQTAAKPAAQTPAVAGRGTPLAFPDALTEPPAWADANVPFDLAAYLRAPPPEENAAPLYLEAFTDIDGEMMYLTFGPYEELSAAQQAEYKRVLMTFRDRSRKQMQIDQAWESDPNSVDAAEVDAWLAEFDKAFRKLAVAQQRPTCMFQTGYSVFTLLPHLQGVRQVDRVVKWRTRRDIQRGDLERPLADLKMLLRLIRDLQVRGPQVAQLTAQAVQAQCCEIVRMLLNAPDIDVAHCDRLLALLREHEAIEINMFVEGYRAEYIICRQALHDLQHRAGTFDPEFMREEMAVQGNTTSPLAGLQLFLGLKGDSPEPTKLGLKRFGSALQPTAWTGGHLLSDEDYANDVKAVDRYFATLLSTAERPDFLRTGDADFDAAWEPMKKTVLAALILPAENALLDRLRLSAARFAGVECLVALRRWQLEHDQPPRDLETLVRAAGMPAVPADPFSDQPLHMGAVDGKVVIYSVGPDGKDDQAQVEWDYGWRDPGDLVFRLEKSLN
jgi:hypothetical protein